MADPKSADHRVGRRPLLQHGETLIPAEGAPPVTGGLAPCVVRLGDGADVLMWGDGGYELKGDALVKTFDLGPMSPHEITGEWAVPSGEDGFFHLAGGRLYEVGRGRPAVRHAPWLEHISTVTAGPDGSLLLHEYYDWNKELGEVYFPADGTFIRLDLALVKEEQPRAFQSLHWLPGCDRLLIDAAIRLWSLPGEFVRSLPRQKPKAGKKASRG